MSYHRTRLLFAASLASLTIVGSAAAMVAGCGKVVKAAVTAAEWDARAVRTEAVVHNAVKAFDAPAAKAGVAELEGMSRSAQSAAVSEGTAAARTSAGSAKARYRGADHESRTSWIEDFRGKLKDEAKDKIRDAFRRAACDEVKTMLDYAVPFSSQWYAAEVTLYLHGQLADADSVDEARRVATQYFDVLSGLNPKDPDDQAVLSYLAYTAYCPEAVSNLQPKVAGWGIVLTEQDVKVVNSRNQPVALLAPGTLVQVKCTIYWFAVTGPYGTTSILWDFVGTGYVPDAYLYTGTNAPVAVRC